MILVIIASLQRRQAERYMADVAYEPSVSMLNRRDTEEIIITISWVFIDMCWRIIKKSR